MTVQLPQVREQANSEKLFPVIEVFGPTIQGEGPDMGKPCYFVRFGGCDYRCSWCDSMYAVDPAEVRKNAIRMTAVDIVDRLWELRLGKAGQLVILSGGNPALHRLGDLVGKLQVERMKVAVETQGSVWRPWLGRVDSLVVSPKPPSSGMATPKHREQFARFMADAVERQHRRIALKIVVFDREDLEWARSIHNAYRGVPFYLSAGTDQDVTGDDAAVREAVADKYRWLCEQAVLHHDLSDARITPQMHVIAWGAARGV